MLAEQVSPPQTDEFLHLPQELYEHSLYWSKSNVIRQIIGGIQFRRTDVLDQVGVDYSSQGDDIQAAVDVGHQLLDPDRPMVTPRDSRALRINAQYYDLLEHQSDPDKPLRTFDLTDMQRTRMQGVAPLGPYATTLPLKWLLRLEGGTTQVTAAALLLQERTNAEIRNLLESVRPDQVLMLSKSLDVRARILGARALGTYVKLDERDIDYTLLRHLQAIYSARKLGSGVQIKPLHSEDIFVSIFSGSITPDEALKRFPQISHHETNRYLESIRILNQDRAESLDTNDHRAALAAILLLGFRSWTDRTARALRKTIPNFNQLHEVFQDHIAAN